MDPKPKFQKKTNQPTAPYFIFGCISIALIVIVLIVNKDLTADQRDFFRILFALGCAGVAAVIPGVTSLKYKMIISASGAIVVFFIILKFYQPVANAAQNIQHETINGTWQLTMVNCYTLPANGTPIDGHWTIKGLLNLQQRDDNTITGRFSSRSYIYCAEADVAGSLEGDHLTLKITCSKGGCFQSGFMISARLVGNAFQGSNSPLPDRPADCMLKISNQLTIERR